MDVLEGLSFDLRPVIVHPFDDFRNPCFEVDARLPTQLAARARRVDDVRGILARAFVDNLRHVGKWLVQASRDRFYHVPHPYPRIGREMINLAHAAV